MLQARYPALKAGNGAANVRSDVPVPDKLQAVLFGAALLHQLPAAASQLGQFLRPGDWALSTAGSDRSRQIRR